jgi:hypothetical protein
VRRSQGLLRSGRDIHLLPAARAVSRGRGPGLRPLPQQTRQAAFPLELLRGAQRQAVSTPFARPLLDLSSAAASLRRVTVAGRYTWCKRGCLQYVIIRPITTFAAVLAQINNVLCPGTIDPRFGYVWINVINLASVTVAMYALVLPHYLFVTI